jgi:hypothetical protein
MARFPSGVTDQYIYFVAVDATDKTSFETGLSSFTVHRSRNGAAAAAFTTPTINETDSSNMPGIYELLLDEDMTIDSGDEEQDVVLRVTHAGMHPVTLKYSLFRPKITAGETLAVSSGAGSANVTQFGGSAGTFSGGRPEVNTTHAAGTAWNSGAIGASTLATDTITAAKIAADAIGASELAADAATEIATAVWASGTRVLTAGTNIQLPSNGLANVAAWTVALTGNITGDLSGSVGSIGTGGITTGSFASGAINAAAIAANAIGASELASDAVAEIQSGLALATDLATVAGYLDTEILAIKAKTDLIPASPAAVGDIPTANQNADALLDRADAIETGLTFRKALRLLSAMLGGKVSGGGGGTEVFRNALADSKDRVTVTVDAHGNRSAVTTDLS